MPQNNQILNTVNPSIIDISNEKLDLTVEKDYVQNEPQIDPPYWENTNIYSFDEIKKTNQAQKNYYCYLKNKILRGKTIDLQGNTNYAFLLFFDFLNEYQNHRNIQLLEEQFKLIAQICPITKNYTSRLLQDELKKCNDSLSIEKLKNLDETSNQIVYSYNDDTFDLYLLGNQYKEKLGLDTQEINWLNKLHNTTTLFLSIEGCCVSTIIQYNRILKELNIRLKRTGTTLFKEVTYFKEKLTKMYAFAWDWNDETYIYNIAESKVYLTMFRRVENSVRDSFGHKRKVSADFPNVDKNLSVEFENRVGSLLNALIEDFKCNLRIPDFETQIALNTINIVRWKIEFEKLKKSFNPELISNFNDGIIHLEETNQKNPNIKNIFFEASSFISEYDKIQSLNYYAKYIYYDLKTKSFGNKELPKIVQKSLFKTQEQLNEFKEVIADLITTSDIHAALEKISKHYIPKRKKILLDKSKIAEVKQKHEETVELLNEYLSPEKNETFNEIITINNVENKVTIIHSEDINSIFISEISLGKVQEELIKRIVTNSFKIYQDEVNIFANENQMFKNQLVDSINESCSDYLDGEALIEEDGDIYIMEESYFKIITK